MQSPTSGREPSGPVLSRWRRLRAVSAVAACSVAALLVLGTSLDSWRARNAVIQSAAASVEALASVVGAHALQSFQMADAVIHRVRDLHLAFVERAGESEESFAEKIFEVVSSSLQPTALTVVNETGARRFAGADAPPPSPEALERMAFHRHRIGDAGQPIVTGPSISAETGEAVIVVSRPMQSSDGRFAGVVAVEIGVDDFRRFYGRVTPTGDHVLALGRSDGILLVRQPRPDADVPSSWPDLSALPSRGADGVGLSLDVGASDGRRSVVAWRGVGVYPLVAVAAIDREALLAPWRRDAALRALTLGGALLLLFSIGHGLFREMRLRESAEEVAAASERRFREFASMGGDFLWEQDADLRFTYVSPGSFAPLGIEPASYIGKPLDMSRTIEIEPGNRKSVV